MSKEILIIICTLLLVVLIACGIIHHKSNKEYRHTIMVLSSERQEAYEENGRLEENIDSLIVEQENLYKERADLLNSIETMAESLSVLPRVKIHYKTPSETGVIWKRWVLPDGRIHWSPEYVK